MIAKAGRQAAYWSRDSKGFQENLNVKPFHDIRLFAFKKRPRVCKPCYIQWHRFVSPATLETEAGLLQIHGFYRLWSEFKANLGELNDTPSEIKK